MGYAPCVPWTPQAARAGGAGLYTKGAKTNFEPACKQCSPMVSLSVPELSFLQGLSAGANKAKDFLPNSVRPGFPHSSRKETRTMVFTDYSLHSDSHRWLKTFLMLCFS